MTKSQYTSVDRMPKEPLYVCSDCMADMDEVEVLNHRCPNATYPDKFYKVQR